MTQGMIANGNRLRSLSTCSIPLHKLPLINHLHTQLLRLRQLAPRFLAGDQQARVLADAARRLAAEGADALLDRLAREMLEAAGGNDGFAGQGLVGRGLGGGAGGGAQAGRLRYGLGVDSDILELLDGVAPSL